MDSDVTNIYSNMNYEATLLLYPPQDSVLRYFTHLFEFLWFVMVYSSIMHTRQLHYFFHVIELSLIILELAILLLVSFLNTSIILLASLLNCDSRS